MFDFHEKLTIRLADTSLTAAEQHELLSLFSSDADAAVLLDTLTECGNMYAKILLENARTKRTIFATRSTKDWRILLDDEKKLLHGHNTLTP